MGVEKPSSVGRLKGSLIRKLQQRELPSVVASEPKEDETGLRIIRFTDKKDGLPAGQVKFEILPTEVVIHDFSRAAHRQKGGYGAACFKQALEHIDSNFPGLPIRMSVLANNVRAEKLYRANGFRWEDETAISNDPNTYHTMTRKPVAR